MSETTTPLTATDEPAMVASAREGAVLPRRFGFW